MSSLVDTLISFGYSRPAAQFFVSQPIARPGCSEIEVESRLNSLIGNYYMQYLAIRMEAYGFDLNRFDISPTEMSHADNLIAGRLGMPALDSLPVATLLEAMVIAVRKKHMFTPVTWQALYDFKYAPVNGHCLAGKELLNALIRSNKLHNGSRATHYKHRFNGLIFSTLSMHEVMAVVLKEGKPKHLTNVNRYGQEVKPLALEQLKAMARALPHLSSPEFHSFFDMNAHHNIKKYIGRVFNAVSSSTMDLVTLIAMQEALKRENYNPDMYPSDWRRFLEEVDIWLEAIATPYAESSAAAAA
jgi:hypothetical protein